ncbi:hypothetical protein BX600DRAFT_474616 [Xylariales sp. PMI_506]|nr:hypothetical protein BX600DRAFT_474616 [Xylariales sp. PMI_506]
MAEAGPSVFDLFSPLCIDNEGSRTEGLLDVYDTLSAPPFLLVWKSSPTVYSVEALPPSSSRNPISMPSTSENFTLPSHLPPETIRVAEQICRTRRHACHFDGCAYRCALPKDLRKHVIKHKRPHENDCYRCPNLGCGKTFPRADNGVRHTKYHCPYRSAKT